MTGSAVRLAVLSVGLLAGSFLMKAPVPCVEVHDSRLLYVLGQYKMAMGDENSGKELVRRAAEAERNQAAVAPAARSNKCPASKG
jgi:hypothetical protein